jgi:elongation factor 1-gamma
VYPVLGLSEYDAALFNQAKTDLFAGLATLESHLLLNTYLVGNAITLADIVMASALLYPFKFVLDGNCRKRFPSVVRWFTTLVNQPEFIKSMGEVTLCVKQVQPAGAGKGGNKGKGKGKGKGKQQQQGKKGAQKQQKKQKKKAAQPPPPPKKEATLVDKLKKLPRSKFSMMAWLREYMSRNEDKSFAQAMPWFFEHFDAAGWSVWFMKYKFGESNKTDFFAGNQMSGFFQRATEMVKPNLLFGQVMAFNSGSYFDIEGAIIIRGTTLEPLLESNASAGSYDFAAYDNSNEEHRAKLTALWCTQYGQQYGEFEVDDTRDSITCH